eukprot:350919-Chlamydomonas_euryale.AAC.5
MVDASHAHGGWLTKEGWDGRYLDSSVVLPEAVHLTVFWWHWHRVQVTLVPDSLPTHKGVGARDAAYKDTPAPAGMYPPRASYSTATIPLSCTSRSVCSGMAAKRLHSNRWRCFDHMAAKRIRSNRKRCFDRSKLVCQSQHSTNLDKLRELMEPLPRGSLSLSQSKGCQGNTHRPNLYPTKISRPSTPVHADPTCIRRNISCAVTRHAAPARPPHLEVATANQQVRLDALCLLHAAQRAVDAVELAMCTALDSNLYAAHVEMQPRTEGFYVCGFRLKQAGT